MFAPRAIVRREDGRYSVTADLPGAPAVDLTFEVSESSDGGIVAVSIPDEIRAATGPDTRPAKPLFTLVTDFHRAAGLRSLRAHGPSSYAGTLLSPAAVTFLVDASGKPPAELREIAGVDRIMAAVASFHQARNQ
jgi:hypothetical protein